MIDLHAHILPGLDDGAEDMDDALELAEMAVEGGVEILVATPHSNQKGNFENYYSPRLTESYRQLCEAIERRQIPLKLLLGMEIYASEDMKERILDGSLTGLNGSDYYLIEFPFDADPDEISEGLKAIRETGKVPLAAHPERYFCVQEAPWIVYDWVQGGCRTQVNKSSILGRFGKKEEYAAHILLDYGLVTCVASDAHSPHMRTTYMEDIQDYLEEQYGRETVYRLLKGNPEKIIENRGIAVHGRCPDRKRHFWR